MKKVIAVGVQDFAKLRERSCFYIDKTSFIKEWWEREDDVTLITRPRRFGKTLNMSMLNYFFSCDHAGRADLFEGLEIWGEERYRNLQGTWPVISLSFAGVKYTDYTNTRTALNSILADLLNQYAWLLKEPVFTDADRKSFSEISRDMDDAAASQSLLRLCRWLYLYYGKKCILLLDEYDTPMQEAYVHGFWDKLTAYMRALFNNAFKTNPYLERGIMTGITRVSRESIFSDLNNINVITTTSDEYAAAFGFTEAEVFNAMDEQGFPESEKEYVKYWYDGFTFGKIPDIYNPWSVILYLDKGSFDTYWANTSANSLIGKLLRESDTGIKSEFEMLLSGGSIECELDEQIVFDQLTDNRNAIWSLLLASGYLKVDEVIHQHPEDDKIYLLKLTNYEVKRMFYKMVKGWFEKTSSFNEFVSAMFRGDVRSMNHYMNRVALNTFSYFDTGDKPSDQKEPERFYHGFVLGLLVDKADRYILKSNRESGLGRYDVVMEPMDADDVAVIMEFKVYDKEDHENTLEDTAKSALDQIEEKQYAADLLARGIPDDRILRYGFAFQGERCLIKKEG